MYDSASSYRHQPTKTVLPPKRQRPEVNWRKEPAVTGHRRLLYANKATARDIPVPISASPAIIRDVGVIVASDDGFIRLFSPGLERVYWERRLPSSIYASVIVDSKAERIIVASTGGEIAAFSLRGDVIWFRELGIPIFATPALNPDLELLILAGFGHKALGLSLADGSSKFETDLPLPWYHRYAGLAANRNPYASPAVTADGRVVFCSGQHVILVDYLGKEYWRLDLKADIKASPITDTRTNSAIVACVNGSCNFINLDDGQVINTIWLDDKVTASGAVSGDSFVLGGRSNRVWCVNLFSAELCWTRHYGAPREYTSFTITPFGDFLSTTMSGNITCFALKDGRFLWESSQVLGLPNHDPRMDITPTVGPAGHMYCGSYSGDLYEFTFESQEGQPA